MDLVNQNKFKNILIIVLLGMNILTLSIIWMQTLRGNDDSRMPSQDKAGSESVKLIKDALNLNDEQTKQLEKIRSSKLDLSKKYKDSLDQLKKDMGEEFLKAKPDSVNAAARTRKIGELEAKALLLRYQHFNELLAICTPGQREKLKPIIAELFGRKPAERIEQKRDHANSSPLKKNSEVKKGADAQDSVQREFKNAGPDRTPDRPDGRPAPPSVEEKMDRLTKKLNLSEEQAVKIKSLIITYRQKDQELRRRVNPDPEEIENEKRKNKKEEDEGVLKILNSSQRDEYLKIMENRRK
ncbi:MAG: Spy/CpxP family protein refolding chaperone [Syntrophothermus sp.]